VSYRPCGLGGKSLLWTAQSDVGRSICHPSKQEPASTGHLARSRQTSAWLLCCVRQERREIILSVSKDDFSPRTKAQSLAGFSTSFHSLRAIASDLQQVQRTSRDEQKQLESRACRGSRPRVLGTSAAGQERDHSAGSRQFLASAGLLSGGSAVVSSDFATAAHRLLPWIVPTAKLCYNAPNLLVRGQRDEGGGR
jgi:hypothetical protein